jgi:hypothetical protein
MVHGLATNLAFWYIRYVSAFSKRYRVTLYDLRGHGRSSITDSGYTPKNMAVDLQKLDGNFNESENIYQVKSQKDAVKFANTASEAFGYRVDANTVHISNQDTSRIKFFNYEKNNECSGCGIVYFDSFNNAGLHMIGTIPKEQGKGIGKKMTEKLIIVFSNDFVSFTNQNKLNFKFYIILVVFKITNSFSYFRTSRRKE